MCNEPFRTNVMNGQREFTNSFLGNFRLHFCVCRSALMEVIKFLVNCIIYHIDPRIKRNDDVSTQNNTHSIWQKLKNKKKK